MKLKNKIAVVTGAAMGIGKAIVEEFLKEGAFVFALDKDKSLNQIIKNFNSDKVKGFVIDLKNKKEVKEVFYKINNEVSQIDILVNNAGVCKMVSFLETTESLFKYHLSNNLLSAFYTTKEVVDAMIKNKKGSIINMSSVTGDIVSEKQEVAYATSKTAIKGFSKSLAADLLEYNIRVNCIQPSFVMSPMSINLAKEESKDYEKVLQSIKEKLPIKRFATPLEVAKLTVFLASDDASYITGQSYVIDGGSTLPEM